MSKFLFSSIVVTASLISGFASAGKMKCYVDTPAYDHYNTGGCFNVGVARTTSAVFKVSPSKSVEQVVWSGDGAGKCRSTSQTCSVSIRQYQTKSVGAKVLYTDGSWENFPAIQAWYEGFH